MPASSKSVRCVVVFGASFFVAVLDAYWYFVLHGAFNYACSALYCASLFIQILCLTKHVYLVVLCKFLFLQF